MKDSREELIHIIGTMLLPLVSPYDLSQGALNKQFNYNVIFNRTVQQVFHFIDNKPLTREKILNDIKIMTEMNLH